MNDSLQDFLVVESGNRWFALPTRAVDAAVAPRPVTPLPFVPPWVEGLINVNERILPLVDLRRLLGMAQPTAGGELVVIESPRGPCALRVDRVVGKADIAAGDVQSHRGEGDSAADAAVCGRFEWDAHSVLVLDDDAIGRCVNAGEAPQGQRGLLGRLQQDEDAAAQRQQIECVLFESAGENYALGLQDVVEILDLPAATPVPGAPPAAEGLARVRDEVVLVLSLARLLRRGDSRDDAHSVVIVEREGIRYGLRVDRLEGIQSFDPDALRRIEDEGSELIGVLAQDERLFGLLTASSVISHALHATLAPLVPRRNQAAEAQRETLHPVLQVALGDEDFAIPLGNVRRIAEYSAAEPLRDGEQGLVSGAVTVDGNVLPVVDLGRVLQADGSNTGAWVIVGSDDREWAIAVREAKQILDIPQSAIEEIGGRADGFVTAVANVDRRLISLLSMAPLLATARQQRSAASANNLVGEQHGG